jgi:hypothetical protein
MHAAQAAIAEAQAQAQAQGQADGAGPGSTPPRPHGDGAAGPGPPAAAPASATAAALLGRNVRALARSHRMVTVMFCDIVGACPFSFRVMPYIMLFLPLQHC